MNIAKLFNMQRVLDDRIVKEKGLEGQDLLPQKILALQVELGECAQNWRGFKFWSKDQQPRKEIRCAKCSGKGEYYEQYGWTPSKKPPKTKCGYCNGKGYTKQPLLEEYIDCLHFILSIGNDIGIETTEIRPYESESIERRFINLMGAVSELKYEGDRREIYYLVFDAFFGLGEMLGFTWEQIEAAYMEKNQTNHDRQSNGY